MSKIRELRIVPDVLCSAPQKTARVIFPSGATISIGSELTPLETKEAPEVGWEAESESFYTVCMVDPDAPSKEDPFLKEWNHWLVGNIPGNNIEEGDVLAEYIGPAPPKGTGYHRYVILVYKQFKEITFEREKKLKSTSMEGREKFYIKKFSKKYKLSDPVAGNVFLARWDESVPMVNTKLLA